MKMKKWTWLPVVCVLVISLLAGYEVRVHAASNENTVVSVYYAHSSWKNGTAYIHYKVAGSTWTTAPGKLMKKTTSEENKLTGCTWRFDISLGAANSASLCFNNGNGRWDSNNGGNYKLNEGTYKVVYSSSQKKSSVSAISFATATPKVTATPSNLPSKEPTKEPVITTTPVQETKGAAVQITYRRASNTSWNDAFIHYKLEDGSWTGLPGMPMKKTGSGLWYYSLPLGNANSAKLCFNNGNGVWDNNSGKNYTVIAGTYTIDAKNKLLTYVAPTTTPVVTEEPTATPVVTEEPTATPVVTEEPTATPVVTEEPTATPVVTEEPTATPVVTEEPTVTPAPVEKTVKMTVSGKEFNEQIKALANGMSFCGYSYYDDSIRFIRVVTKKPVGSSISEHTISLSSEGLLEAYYDQEDKAIILYTDMDKITLPEDASYMFCLLANLQAVDMSAFDSSDTTNMGHMFEGACINASDLDVSFYYLDTRKVTNMDYMFAQYGESVTESFDMVFGEKFDTGAVTSAEGMFYFTGMCALDDIIFVNELNTANVNNMKHMFLGTGMFSEYFTSLSLTDGFVLPQNASIENIFEGTGSAALGKVYFGNRFTLDEYMSEEEIVSLLGNLGKENCKFVGNEKFVSIGSAIQASSWKKTFLQEEM